MRIVGREKLTPPVCACSSTVILKLDWCRQNQIKDKFIVPKTSPIIADAIGALAESVVPFRTAAVPLGLILNCEIVSKVFARTRIVKNYRLFIVILIPLQKYVQNETVLNII